MGCECIGYNDRKQTTLNNVLSRKLINMNINCFSPKLFIFVWLAASSFRKKTLDKGEKFQ